MATNLKYFFNNGGTYRPEIDANTAASLLPIGTQHEFPEGSTISIGYVEPLGQLLSRTAYYSLWAWVEATQTILDDATWVSEQAAAPNGQLMKYSTGDGSTTFRIPHKGTAISKEVDIVPIGEILSGTINTPVGYNWKDFEKLTILGSTAGNTRVETSVDVTKAELAAAPISWITRGWASFATTTRNVDVTATSATTAVVSNSGAAAVRSIVGYTNYLGNIFIYSGI